VNVDPIDFMLVTTGTTGFDELVAAADRAASRLGVRDGLIQYGPGRLVPSALPAERFVPSLDPYYDKATVVVAHGGAGTALEVLGRGLPLVAAANGDRYDDHQRDLLVALSEAGHLVWCRDLDRLDDAVRAALAGPLRPLPPAPCTIALHVDRLLAGLPAGRRLRSPLRRPVSGRSGGAADPCLT
jgi:UDP-N-acetylglucosamine transferase subunit ALG13